MVVLEVKVNGELLARAGRDDLCALHAIVNAIGRLGSESSGTKSKKDGFYLRLDVGGLSARSEQEPGTHARWANTQEINVGDEVSIRIVESDRADEPAAEKPEKVENLEERNRKLWESAREIYMEFKDKFEP